MVSEPIECVILGLFEFWQFDDFKLSYLESFYYFGILWFWHIATIVALYSILYLVLNQITPSISQATEDQWNYFSVPLFSHIKTSLPFLKSIHPQSCVICGCSTALLLQVLNYGLFSSSSCPSALKTGILQLTSDHVWYIASTGGEDKVWKGSTKTQILSMGLARECLCYRIDKVN